MYSCVPTGIQLYTPAFNVVTFYFTETFPHCNCRSAVNDSAGGSFSQQHVGSSQAGFRVEFSEFCAILNRQFKFTGVTGVSKFGTYSSTAVLEY